MGNSGEISMQFEERKCNYIDFITHQQLLTPGSPLNLLPGAVPQEKAGGHQGNTPQRC